MAYDVLLPLLSKHHVLRLLSHECGSSFFLGAKREIAGEKEGTKGEMKKVKTKGDSKSQADRNHKRKNQKRKCQTKKGKRLSD